MLVISCLIGTFYGFFAKKQETSQDFLLGGSSMGTLPMAMSLAASFITAIELLGNPAEMYEQVYFFKRVWFYTVDLDLFWKINFLINFMNDNLEIHGFLIIQIFLLFGD